MVVLDESKGNFVLDVPLVEEVDAKLREEERKKTGRYLAVSVILFLVGLGLYQAISNGSTKMSALLSAALIMFLYLLWLLYASHKRNQQQKISELTVEKQVSQVLENLNNIKTLQASFGPHDNYVYSSSEDEIEKYPLRKEEKLNNQKEQKREQNPCHSKNGNADLHEDKSPNENSSRKSSKSSDIFIRTYSIA